MADDGSRQAKTEWPQPKLYFQVPRNPRQSDPSTRTVVTA